MNTNELFEKAISELNIDEIMKEQLKSNIASALKDSINSLFNYNGCAKKAVKEKVEKELVINLDEINFQDFTSIIEKEIKAVIEEDITGEVRKKTRGILMTDFKVKPVNNINEIIEKWIKELDVSESECGDDPLSGKIIIDQIDDTGNYSKNWSDITIINEVYSDASEDVDDFVIELRLYDNRIISIACDNKHETNGLFDKLEKLQMLGVAVIIDKNEDSFEYSNGPYY